MLQMVMVGGVGSLQLLCAPLFVPSTGCSPFTAAQVVLDQSIYQPLAPPLSLFPLADDKAPALYHGEVSLMD